MQLFVRWIPSALFLGLFSTLAWTSPQERFPFELEVARGAVDSFPLAFEGRVLAPDGTPAAGAAVVSSAGGRTITDEQGNFRLDDRVPITAESVVITATSSSGRRLVASASVGLPALSSVARVGSLRLAALTACQPMWLPTFGQTPPGELYALAVYDDGDGPALYAGGFQSSTLPLGIGRLEGSRWVALGSGVDGGTVYAITDFDDGNGPALFVGGSFSSIGGVAANRVARWDGSSWSALGSGTDWTVDSLTVFDDGSGPALYAAGYGPPGSGSGGVVKWDGATWTSLGSGMNEAVVALAGFDGALYAAGRFTTAGGVAAKGIARWDGSSWAPLGSGLDGGVGDKYGAALTVFDDGNGPDLYVGGKFTRAGGVNAPRIARWNGSSWSRVSQLDGYLASVSALAVLDDGSGPALYAGGDFTSSGSTVLNRVSKWNGTSWTALSTGIDGDFVPRVNALAGFDAGSGPALYAGGRFLTAGGTATGGVARWKESSWTSLSGELLDSVQSLAEFDDGSGPALYAGGAFTNAGGPGGNRIARWNGSGWSALGSGMDSYVFAMTAFDAGGGPALYAGGLFTSAGGTAANRIARWDGSSWSALGSGMSGSVYCMAVFDDGSGPALHAGGTFTTAGEVSANRVAKWDGSSWTPLGSGMNGVVLGLVTYDDGGGPALYAGGDFTSAGGIAANRVAKWDGSSWTPLGSGVDAYINELAVFDDGSGPALYIGGAFTSAGGVAANHVAKWDGSSWSALGSGTDGLVDSLASFDDGGGPALYACGAFYTAGGVAAKFIAKWSGSSWVPVGSGSGMDNIVVVVKAIDDGHGPALYAGGAFGEALDSGDGFLAKWGCDTIPPALACPSSVVALDRNGSPPGETVTFSVEAEDDADPAPTVVCMPPSGSFFPRGTTLVTCTATDASGNQSTCEFPVTVRIKASPR